MAAFERLGMVEQLAKAVEDMDWILPTDIQDEAIPLILGGGDVLMAAETGSGKTGAFCLPIIQIVHEDLVSQRSGGAKTPSGGFSVGSKWKMNVHDRGDAMAIDTEGTLCQSRDMNGWHGSRSNKAVHGSGCYYYEATVTDEGLCRIGWSTDKARLELGTDAFSFGFGGTGKMSHKKQFDTYGEAFGINDVIGCYLDLDKYEVRWSKNGKDLDKAYDIQPQLRNESFYAAVVLKNAEMRMNFGDNLKYKPKGYTALNQAPPDCVTNSKILGSGGTSKKPSNNAPQALIIEPSRELAEQTYKQIEHFRVNLSNPTIRNCLVIGGVNVREQMAIINAGVDIVVGTPGRIEDLISGGHLELHQVRFFILDEADALLSQGYGELINRLHKQIPKVTNDGKRLQMVVCSATLKSFDVKKMAERLMYFPNWIDLKGSLPDTVHHVVCIVDPSVDTQWTYMKSHIKTDGVHHQAQSQSHQQSESLSEGVKVLKGEYVVRAIEKHKMEQALIFCRTKLDCDNLERYLNDKLRGKSTAICLHSDIRPPQRKENLEKFKNEKVNFLICTDVAARGIDIKGLPHVINVTLPDDKNNYIHRIGRVGRAERMGLAISFVSNVKEKVWYHSNCNTRGKGCYNTNLTDHGGCCIWYNEPQLLADIEEEMGLTIDQIDTTMTVPVAEFDGKVTYGKKRKEKASAYQGHVAQLAPTVQELARLETHVQTSFLEMKYGKRFCT